MRGFRRILRVRFLSAVLLCLPGICLSFWYAWSAYANFDRYRRASGEERRLTVEDFHLQVFDLLRRDLRRMGMPPPPEPPDSGVSGTSPSAPEETSIPHLSLHLAAEEMDTLLKGAELESKRPYAEATLTRGKQVQKVKMRLRGSQHWHLLGEKKSYKFKLPKGELFDGHRIFNLLNDPMPMKVGEQLIMNLVREQGVLTPESSFARLELNGKDLGLFHFLAQVDESVLRKNRRMPGGMYSGNLPSSAATEELWRDSARWKKVAWRGERDKDDKGELDRLLRMVHQASVADFVEFARREVNLEAFAAFDAVDVLFGGDQHNFRENHKLYFDPYKQRWEPVAWNFRAFRHDPVFNAVENPLLLRLKTVPEYLSLRNRMLHRLLTHEASPPALRERAVALLRMLAAELASDPYWAAYKLLPNVDRFHRRMMRPMDLERLALVLASELETYAQRHAFLLDELRRNPFFLEWSPGAREGRVLVSGRSGAALQSLSLRWEERCDAPWRVLLDGAPISPRVQGEQVKLAQPVRLYPALRLVAHENPSKKRGDVRARSAPADYRLRIEGGCRPAELRLQATHLATGSRIYARDATTALAEALPGAFMAPDSRPVFKPGQILCHPAKLRKPAPEDIRLGPGEVFIPVTRVYAAHQAVSVAAGSTFKLGPGASLIFQGRVTFQGRPDKPIRLRASGGQAWGGLLIQGPASAGSRLSHVQASGGTRVRSEGQVLPGMINIHDTKDIRIRDCRFGGNRGSDDVVHLAYIEDLRVEDCEVRDAASDAFDLEFVQGEMSRVQVVRAKDEAVDLMGSRLEISDGIFLFCGGNAISAGEETRARIQDVLIAHSGVGVLAKNASRVDLSEALLFSNPIGLRIYRRTVRYQGDSQVATDAVFVVGSEKLVKTDDESRGNRVGGVLQTRLPRRGVLRHLVENVLELDSLDDLDPWIETRAKGGTP